MKKSLSILLITSMLLWIVPAADAFGLEKKTMNSKSGSDEQTAAPGQVVVLYEEGAVDTQPPETKAEQNSMKKARKARSFGTAMSESSGSDEDGAQQAENTLGQQADILSESLGSNYVIEDTVVFSSGDEEKNKPDETVVSTISSDNYTAEQLIDKLSANENIVAAEPNYIFHALDMPDWNDTFINEIWQNTDKGINADKVWNDSSLSGEGDPVVIAVVDTGINYYHEELADRMWTAPKGFKLKGEHGMDFVYKTDDPMDENGHGTHCAGIIAAAANNGAGIGGVAGQTDKIQLLAARVLDEDGSGTFEDIISAFYYLIRAKNEGVNIKAINCSLGANVSSEIFDTVLDKVGQNGMLTIAAAGNEQANNDEVPSAPANSNSDYVISVAALDDDGELASYSNYGARNVDIAAPGSNILSSVSYDNYTPYLYDNAKIGKTTEYYGEFGGAEIIEEADAEGNITQKVTPVSGTDYFGEQVTTAGAFGESVMIADKVDGSTGTATIDLVEGGDSSFPIGNNKTSLRWNIKDAKSGDVYVLYFPYEKMGTDGFDSYMNMVFHTHTDSNGGYGSLQYGDIIAYVDKNGKLTYRTAGQENFIDAEYPISEDWNSIWHGSGAMGLMFPHNTIKALGNNDGQKDIRTSDTEDSEGYGMGLIYTAMDDGDIYVDLSSLAISKIGADEADFGQYDIYSGTSMATPMVTGSVGLIAAMNPGLSAEELRDKLYATTRGGYSDICSTGGAVDFSNYSKESSSDKPVVSEATSNFDKKTVTLKVRNAGQSPKITAEFVFADRTEEISPEDITSSDGKITINDNYGLIGSEVKFIVENSDNGLTGQRTMYLVKGLKSYSDFFTMDAEEEQSDDFDDWPGGGRTDKLISSESPESEVLDEEEDPGFPAGLTYIKGANKLLLYDNDSIYRLHKNEQGKYTVDTAGVSISETVDKYAAKMAKQNSLWAPDEPDKENTEGERYYTTEMIGEPACMGNVVYTLVKVDLVDRESVLLLGIDLANKDKWTVYYDSLGDFGSKPEDLDFSYTGDTTLGAYNGKLYYFYGYEYDEETGALSSNTKVYSCTPSSNGSKWESSAEMPAAVSQGKVIGQGGNLYYFFGRKDDGSLDYNIYKFNGSEWSLAGTLPPAVYKNGKDDFMLMFFGTVSEDLSCAYGIDDQGIIFAGRSFDGVGDTFRFNTKTGKVENLGYTLWGSVAEKSTDGTIVGSKLVVQYLAEDDTKVVAKSVPVKTGYVTVNVKTTGKGKGSIYGAGSFPKGEKTHITITPAKGSYVYKINSKGLSPNLNKKYGKATKASKKTLSTDFKGAADATLNIHFGKISTKLTVKKVKTVKVGKRRLKAWTDGTINGVRWKSSNKKYAKVNKNGTITFKKKGIGKTVKLTAISKENPKLKKTIKVKIKKNSKKKKK